MAMIVSVLHIVLVTAVVLQVAVSHPHLNRLEEEVDIDRRISLPDYSLLMEDARNTLSERRQGQQSDIEFSDRYARQLGDIEFSNRYAEYLRSKAKITSICGLLQRMQNAKKSGLGADTERVNALLKQYMCPAVYQ